MEPTMQPWWQRFEQCALASPQTQNDCWMTTTMTTQCKLETSDQGLPLRRCQRTIQKFRECRGQAREELECTREETIDYAAGEQVLPPTHSLSADTPARLLEAQNRILDSDSGAVLDELLQQAERLRQKLGEEQQQQYSGSWKQYAKYAKDFQEV